MAFVNEFASKEDLEKYGVADLQKTRDVPRSWTAWTIDRDRNIIFMKVANGRDEHMNHFCFLLLREGKAAFPWLVQNVDFNRKAIVWNLPHSNHNPKDSSDEKWPHFELFCRDLKEALRAYKATGPFEDPCNDYEIVEFANF